MASDSRPMNPSPECPAASSSADSREPSMPTVRTPRGADSPCAAAGLPLDSKAESYLERSRATLHRRPFPPRSGVRQDPDSRCRRAGSDPPRFPRSASRRTTCVGALVGGPRPDERDFSPGSPLADDPVARIVRRRVPTVLASVGPAVDDGMPLTGFDADANASPEGHQDLARPPRMPVRARGRVRPPDRKIVRQVTIAHRSIRTHVPHRQPGRPSRRSPRGSPNKSPED